jgi:protease-4
MANKYGITTDGVTTNNNANRSILSKQTENEAKAMQLHIDNTYEIFKTYVSEDRKIKMDIVNEIAQGKIYTGSQAVKNHLVDELGDFNKALADLKNLIHSDSTYIIKYRLPKEKNNLGKFSSMFVKTMAKFNQNVALELFNMLQDNSNIKSLLPKNNTDTKTQIKSFMPLVVTEAK